MEAHIALEGTDPLIKLLDKLPDAVFKRGVGGAARKAMKDVVARAKAGAPVESGTLKESIGIKQKRYPRSGAVVTIVGPRSGMSRQFNGRKRDPIYYAHLQEGGHRIVRPYSLKVRYSKKVGGFVRAKGTGVTLSSVPGRPFLRPALENIEYRVVAKFRDEILNFVERYVKRFR